MRPARRSLTTLALAVVAGAALLAQALLAQEGHPLSGTWTGDWGPNAQERNHLTFVMNWDGKAVTGLINPGRNAMNLTGVSIDFSNWTVRIEAGSGDMRITAEGRLEDLASVHRTITGTWRQGAVQGDFKLTRE